MVNDSYLRVERIYSAILSLKKVYHYDLTKIFDDDLSNEVEKYKESTETTLNHMIKKWKAALFTIK